MNLLVVINIFVLYLASEIKGARILGLIHVPAFSHQQLGHTLLAELAAKGHEVTLISPMPPKNPTKNLRTLELKIERIHDQPSNLFDVPQSTTARKMIRIDMIGLFLTESVLNHTVVQTLLKSHEEFDLVIIEQFLNEAFKGLCYHFKAPCVLLSTIGPSRWTNPQMANPGPPSYVPDMYLSFSTNMNFWERTYNTLTYVGGELLAHLYTLPKQNQLLQKYFPGAPHLFELHYNTSLILLNSHVSTNAPVPQVPNMIDIGGFHVKPPKPLPKELQEYLDNAKEGVIFFSMGSNLKSKDIPKEKREVILKVFSKLKQKVLWKWEEETLLGQPANVKIGKWLPQQDILAHPNIKLFITHGGILSTIETIYHGVPIVGIPIFGDQEMNVANAQISGFGLGVTFNQLTEQSFGDALNEVLNNPKYTENAKRRSKIMHDQPMKPLDRAVFWVEYVLRHRGAPHLRSAALNLKWYQYLLLDVVAVGVLAAFTVLFAFYKLIKLIFVRNVTGNVKEGKKNN